MPEALETPATSTRIIYAVFDFLRDHKTVLLGSLAVLVVAAVLLDGVYIVKKEERAVLTRFGKVVDPGIPPGIHYALPFVERAHIRKVTRITRRDVATRGDSGTVSFSILSGDANLFEANVALQYRIGNLKNYLYATVDPEAVLTLVVRERLIEIMGQHFIDLIFTTNRDIIQTRLFEVTSEYLKANPIGIELLALNIVDLRPIEETVAAFRDVSDAIAESIQAASNANRRMEKLLARSRGQAEAVVMGAKARANERRLQAESSARVFLDLLETYRNQPSSVTVTRYWQRMRSIFREATLSAVNPGDASAIEINMVEDFMPGVGRIPVAAVAAGPGREPGLTESRRALTTVSETAGHGLEKVGTDRFLMDGRTHNVRGERHHLSTAKLRSLIFDDLSIFSHRHVAPAAVGSAVERDERPMVNRTAVSEDEEEEAHPAGRAEGMSTKQKSEKTAKKAKPEKTTKTDSAKREGDMAAKGGKSDGPAE